MHMNSPLNFGSWLFSGNDNVVDRNMDNAKKILEGAGWQFSYGYWSKIENYKTIRIKLTLVVNNDISARGTVGDVIAAQLNEIGMQINLIKVNSQVYNNYLQNKNYDMILTGTNLSANPSLKYYLGENNISNYSNEELTNILNDVKNISDESLLKEKYKRLDEIFMEDKPSISLYTNKIYLAYNSELSGTIKPTWFNIFNNIETWYKTK
ncbi:Oligopeptide-binding protein AppA precursor [compost metagenome]